MEAQKNARTFTTARVAFAREKYGAVLQRISATDFQDTSVNIQARALILMSYLERQEEDEDLIPNVIRSFEAYLNRDTTFNKSYFAEGWLNFLKIAKKIFYKHPLAEVISEIESMTNLVYKQWLVKKAQACLK